MKKTLLTLMVLFSLSSCSQAVISEEEINTTSNNTESVTASEADNVLDKQIFQTAVDLLNSDKCEEIISVSLKLECKNVIEDSNKLKLALEQLDYNICEDITDKRYKDTCISDIKLKMEELEKENLRTQEIQNKQVLYNQILDEARSSSDAEKCNKIEEDMQKFSCRYSVISVQAMESNDSALCEEIGEENFITICKEELSSIPQE